MFQYSNTSLLFALFFPVNPLFSDKPMVISCVTTEDRISLVPQGSTEVRVATKQSSTTSKETSSAIRKKHHLYNFNNPFNQFQTYPQSIPRKPICVLLAKKQMTLLKKSSGLQQAREAKEAHGQRWHLGWVSPKISISIYRWSFHYKPSILE